MRTHPFVRLSRGLCLESRKFELAPRCAILLRPGAQTETSNKRQWGLAVGRLSSSSSSSSSAAATAMTNAQSHNVNSSNLAYWEKETARLLDTSSQLSATANHDHERHLQQLHRALLFWWMQRTDQGVSQSWNIMDHTVQLIRPQSVENPHGESVASINLGLWVDQAVDCWQHTPENNIMTGRELLERIDSYAPVVLPNLSTCGKVVHCVARHHGDAAEAVALGEDILGRIFRPNSQDRVSGLKFYNILIHAYADSNLPDAPYKAEELLLRMQQVHSIVPDTYTFSGILTAWAKSEVPGAGDRADAILRKMEHLFDNGHSNQSVKLNTHIYSTVVAAFARCGQVDEAEATVRRMMARYEQYDQDPEWLPNVVVFSSLIDALGKSQKPGRVRRAEAVLQEMQDLAESTGRHELRPNAVTFGSVFHVLAQSGESDAPFRAEKLLKSMEKNGVNPNVAIFSSVIDCWAKSRRKESGERAESLLRHMQALHESGMEDVQPNLISFNATMDCFAKSNQKNALKRVEAIFATLVELYEAGNDALKPSVISYSGLLDAISRSRLKDAPERAEAVFEEMKNSGVEPNQISYLLRLITWSRSKRIESPEKALAIFQEMEQLAEQGHPDLKPESSAYNAILDCYAKVGDATRAEHWIKKMEEEIENDNQSVKVETRTYNTLLNAWAKSKSGRAVQQAENILAYMSRSDDCMKPDSFTFSTVMAVLTNNNHREAGQKADVYLERMKQCYRAGDERRKPNKIVYTAAMNAWRASGSPFALERSFDLLQEMKDARDADIAPNNRTYAALLKIIADSRRPDKLQAVRYVFADMEKLGLQPTIFELSEAIKACSLTRGKKSYELALQYWEHVHDPSNPVRANPYCCKGFLRACRNAGDPREVAWAAKRAYEICCNDGFGQLPNVLGALQQTAPDIYDEVTRR